MVINNLDSVIMSALPGSGSLAFMGMPTGMEWVVLLVLGLLIFGRRLPEVGRNLGKGIVEFKKGIKGLEEEIEEESSRPSKKAASRQELPESSSHKTVAREDDNEAVTVPNRRESETK